MSDRVVLCMKWGTLYPADYVNVLYNACRKNLTGDFRFLCLTDDATGFVDGIEHRPIPDLNLTPGMRKSGQWQKIALYLPDLYGFTGRALFTDLDMVICGSLDAMFEQPSAFITTDMGTDWRPNPTGHGTVEAGTCLFAFNLGQEQQILDNFLTDKQAAVDQYTIEQAWVGAQASSMDYWPRGWVVSFKRHLRQPIGLDLFRPPHRPPPGAKVVAFHGEPRPADLIKRNAGFWDRFPHMGHGQVGWMADYWVENGGTLPSG
ncbi:MAG: glycosyltransferase [Cereibacter sphaeroides]|uniref:Glycosyltransferase n=1 Tax=Cereibacter sphaeroides TaxID=1063 RepID=A0A2W5SKN9_CERSP|nr:MAG: glycosyltransferase [Cereibacter sphaeroides]